MLSRATLRTAGLVALALGLCLVLRQVRLLEFIDAAQRWKLEQPLLTAAVSIAAVVAWILSFMPLTPLEVSLGFLLGVKTGYIVVFIGKILGCTASFLLGRTILRDWAQRQFGKNELLQAIDLAITRQPLKICLLIRLAYIPIGLKNFGLAVVSVNPATFVASLVGVEVLNSLVLVSVGSTAKDLGALISGREPKSAGQVGVMAVGCLFLLGLFGYMGVLTKKALQDVRNEKGSPEKEN